MLSKELVEELIDPRKADNVWEYLTQTYMDTEKGGKEEVILSFEARLSDDSYIYCPFSIVYDGTDEDFKEKYNQYLSNFDYNRYFNFLKDQYHINEEDFEMIATKIHEQIYFMTLRDGLRKKANI